MPTQGDPSTTGDRWSSVNEVAGHLGVAVDTVYRWIDKRGLPAHRVGRLWKCKLAEVDLWVRAGGPADVPRASSSGRRTKRGSS